jgi:hypothetical protein
MAAREERLSEDLVLSHVQGEDDIKRFAAFLSTINLVEGMTADCLLRAHPRTRHEEFLMIRDTGTGEIASSSCIIPWQMSYAGAELHEDDSKGIGGSRENRWMRNAQNILQSLHTVDKTHHGRMCDHIRDLGME